MIENQEELSLQNIQSYRLSKQQRTIIHELDTIQIRKKKLLEEFIGNVLEEEDKINLLQQKMNQSQNNEQENNLIKWNQEKVKIQNLLIKQQQKLDQFQRFGQLFDILLQMLQTICEKNIKILNEQQYRENYFSLIKIFEEIISQLPNYQDYSCIECFTLLFNNVSACINKWYYQINLDENKNDYQQQFEELVDMIKYNLNQEKNIKIEKNKQQVSKIQIGNKKSKQKKKLSKQLKNQMKKAAQAFNSSNSQEQKEQQEQDEEQLQIKKCKIDIKELNQKITVKENQIKQLQSRRKFGKDQQEIDCSQLCNEKLKLKQMKEKKQVQLNTIQNKQKSKCIKVVYYQQKIANNNQNSFVVESKILPHEQYSMKFPLIQNFQQSSNINRCVGHDVEEDLNGQFKQEEYVMCQMCGKQKKQCTPD